MTKTNIILLAAALLQGLVFLLVARPFSDAGTETTSSKLPFVALSPGAVRWIEIAGEDGKDIFSFSRDDANDAWRFDQKDGFPIRAGKLGGAADSNSGCLLNKLADVEVGAAIAESASSQEVLGVADERFERRVSLKDGKGAELARFFVARGSRSGTVYLRRAGDNKIFESDDMAYWDLGMSAVDFTGRDFVKIDATEVSRLRMREAGKATVELARSFVGEAEERKPGPWTITSPSAGPADQEKVEELVNRLCDLRLDEVLGAVGSAGSTTDQALATFELDREDGTDTVVIERHRDDGDFEVLWRSSTTSPRSGFRVVVPAWSLGEAASIGLEDLKPEAPTGEPKSDSEDESEKN